MASLHQEPGVIGLWCQAVTTPGLTGAGSGQASATLSEPAVAKAQKPQQGSGPIRKEGEAAIIKN